MTKKFLINLKRELIFLTLQTKVTFFLILVLVLTSLALHELTELYPNSLVANFFFIPIFNRIPSKRSYSSTPSDVTNNVANSIVSVQKAFDEKLSPWFITGIIDGEGMFMIKLKKVSKLKTGWSVEPVFQIDLHKRDEKLLRLIR